MTVSTAKRWLAIGAVGAIAVAACGDDDDDPAAAIAAYCDVIEAVGDELPTDEQFDEILANAPDEIADELQVVVDAFREDPEGAFSDPEVAASFPAIERFEAENCDGGGADDEAGQADPDAPRVDVLATDYAFAFDPPSAGPAAFVITNEGAEVHELILARLVGDATLDEALASEDPEAAGLVETVGFEGPVAPGAEGVLSVADLTPGSYVMVCSIPNADGTPHFELGMVAGFTVG